MVEGWWFSVDGEKFGPVDSVELQKLRDEGRITDTTLVWKEGLAAWMPYSSVTEFPDRIDGTPPELPKPSETDQLEKLPAAKAWHRFLARMIDIWVIGMLVGAAIAYALARVSSSFGLWVVQPGSEYIFGWLVIPISMAIETVLFATFGNSLGKALLGVTVTSLDAQRLTATQYLRRQLGVYWYGLGTGFPFVSLLTMAVQQGHLKDTAFTRYDRKLFLVKAKKLSVIRGVSVALFVVLLLVINGSLQQINKKAEKNYGNGFLWTNEVSGRTVSVPRGWNHAQQNNDAKQAIHVFTGPSYGVYVVFAKEDIEATLDLDSYVHAWVSAVADKMAIALPSRTVYVNGRVAAAMEGTLADDRSQKLRVTIVKKGRHVWRTVIWATSGSDVSGLEPAKLKDLLLDSIETVEGANK